MRIQTISSALTLSILVLTAACNEPAMEILACADLSSDALTVDQASPFGYAPAEIIAFSEGDHQASLSFAGAGAATSVTVTVSSMDDPRYVERQLQEPASGELRGTDGTLPCEDTVQIDASVAITSTDGAFAEAMDGPFEVDSEGIARLSRRVAPEALQGSFDFAVFDPTPYDTVELVFDIELREDGMSGEIWAETYRETADANTWSKVDIATF